MLKTGPQEVICSACRWGDLQPFPWGPVRLIRQVTDEGDLLEPELPALEEQVPCANHPGRPGVGTCERCGDLVCDLCRIGYEHRNTCTSCFYLLWRRGALRTPGASLAAASFWAGLAAVALMAPGCVPSVYVGWVPIVLGLAALARMAPGRRGDWQTAAAGIALGLLATFGPGLLQLLLRVLGSLLRLLT